MKVILTQDIKGVGKKDEVINANDGYARNFLFPKKMAVEANAKNMSALKGRQDSANFKKEQEKEKANEMKQLVFEMINSGGVKLEYQESRNALYAGKFNELAIELSRDEYFCRIYDNLSSG